MFADLLVLQLSSFAIHQNASDRFNINSQLEHLQAKYVGTGHADLIRFEWAVNIQRDSYASYIGHYPMLAYFAIAENESIGRSGTTSCRKCCFLVDCHQKGKKTEFFRRNELISR